MNARHWMGVGTVAALLAGGCAAQRPDPSTGPRSTDPARPAAGPASDEPRWLVNGQPPKQPLTPEQLAAGAAAYSRSAEPAVPVTPNPSTVKFGAPVDPPAAPPTPPGSVTAVAPVSAALPASPPLAPAAGAAVLARAAQNNALDGPTVLPESADFVTPGSSAPLDPLGVRLARRARERPRDPSAQLDYQIYLQLDDQANGAGNSRPQLASDAGLPPDEREVVSAVVDGVAAFRTAVHDDPNLTPTQQIRPLQDMLDRLRSGADLAIGTVALCRQVSAFGRYEPISPARFPAGQTSQVIVYCEVDNFLPRQRPDGQWETQLAEQVSLYTAGGRPVWEDAARRVADVCRDRRRDFYAFERVALPSTLAAGAYRMKVTVTDRAANKMAESDVPLSIDR